MGATVTNGLSTIQSNAALGTSIVRYGNQVNAGNTTIYTVTAGKTLYLCNIVVSVTAAAGAHGTISVDLGAGEVYPWATVASATTPGNLQMAFNPPLAVPAGKSLKIYCDTAGANAQGGISGYEV